MSHPKMRSYDGQEKDAGPISTALFIGAAVFLIAWYLRSLSMASAVGAGAVLITWGISTWLQNSEPKITYLGATSSTASFGAQERNTNFLGKTLIPLVVCVAAVWGVWKLFGGMFLAMLVGGVLAWRILKSLAEERERRKKELEKQFSTALMFGAASVGLAGVGLAALAAGGMRRRR